MDVKTIIKEKGFTIEQVAQDSLLPKTSAVTLR